jgi:SAM-dependent methyltransferase
MPKVIELSPAMSVSMSDDWYEMADPNHFWIQWRFQSIIKQLAPYINKDSRILEIGCGNGVVMKQFEDYLGKPIEGCDLNSFATDNLYEHFSGTVYLYNIYDRLPEMINKFDVVILVDVIEHIENDTDFLNVALQHLKKDGLLVISVPAHQYLFSKYDADVGHLRRYNMSDIKEVTNKINVEVLNVRYWGLILLPIVFVRKYYFSFFGVKNNVKKGFKPPNEFFNKLAKLVMKFETRLFTKPFTGASLMAIVRKKG